MPKMKTNRTVYKKFKVTGSGRVKRNACGISHNTGKKRSKSIRQKRKMRGVAGRFIKHVSENLPYQVVSE